MARPRITIRGWMAAVGVSAVILTGFRSPALAGVMAISGLFIMRCKVAAKPERPMSAIDWISIAGLAVLALFSEYILSWILFFSPGWTNGWPFGLSSQTVLSAAITGWISLMLMTAAAGAGAVVGFICSLLRVGEKHGGQ